MEEERPASIDIRVGNEFARTSDLQREVAELAEALPGLAGDARIEVAATAKVAGLSVNTGFLAVTEREVFFASLVRMLAKQDPVILRIPLGNVGAVHLPAASQKWGHHSRWPYGSLIVYATDGRWKFSALPDPAAAKRAGEAIKARAARSASLPRLVRVQQLEDQIIDWLWRWLYS